MAPSPSLDRKTLKDPDAFLETTRSVFDRIAEHWRQILIALAIVVLAGLAISITVTNRRARVGIAKNALFDARKTLEAEAREVAVALLGPIQADEAADEDEESDEAKSAGKADTPEAKAAAERRKAEVAEARRERAESERLVQIAYKSLDVRAKFPKTVAALEAVAEKHAGTPQASEARLLLGNLFFDHGAPKDAVAQYQKALELARDPIDISFSRAALAYAYENAGQYADAIRELETALKLDPVGMKGDLTLSLARSYSKSGDLTKARMTLDQAISQFPNTETAKTAEAMKGLLPE